MTDPARPDAKALRRARAVADNLTARYGDAVTAPRTAGRAPAYPGAPATSGPWRGVPAEDAERAELDKRRVGYAYSLARKGLSRLRHSRDADARAAAVALSEELAEYLAALAARAQEAHPDHRRLTAQRERVEAQVAAARARRGLPPA
ncbi:hypothetical protein [Pseudonocardia alni]|uniref:Uncharacterized protein n=1 Tax=Pseudonocardia alni TaxID=33907 RepID=A0A852W5W6_PSEA5|nr:hypothetical protein [Pseudonocardia antarctica]NYG01336.1 hypothetical protein [Pseudonocardia antarctica]